MCESYRSLSVIIPVNLDHIVLRNLLAVNGAHALATSKCLLYAIVA